MENKCKVIAKKESPSNGVTTTQVTFKNGTVFKAIANVKEGGLNVKADFFFLPKFLLPGFLNYIVTHVQENQHTGQYTFYAVRKSTFFHGRNERPKSFEILTL